MGTPRSSLLINGRKTTMEINRNEYRNPLISRYASKEMSAIWSEQRKFSTWRRLWVALAEAEAEMGLPITEEQLNELRAHVDDIDFDLADAYEKKLRHDVMAHVHTYGDACPNASAATATNSTGAATYSRTVTSSTAMPFFLVVRIFSSMIGFLLEVISF